MTSRVGNESARTSKVSVGIDDGGQYYIENLDPSEEQEQALIQRRQLKNEKLKLESSQSDGTQPPPEALGAEEADPREGRVLQREHGRGRRQQECGPREPR
jgi:hypothetical protein